jgi:ribosomal protein S6--L-glutamate ligase
MKVGILIFSGPKRDEHAQAERFEEAGRALGVEVVRIHEPSLVLSSDGVGPVEIRLDDEALRAADFAAIVCRPNFIEEPSLHQFTVQAFVNAGFRVVNAGILGPKNKLDQHVRLAEAGVAMPRWTVAHRPEQAAAAAGRIGYPVVVKTAFGTHGKGVFYAPMPETLLPVADYLAVRDGNPMIVEEFVAEANRRDVRAFVLGGKVAAAMERRAKHGDVRANASIGGTGYPTELTHEERRAAVAASAAFGLDIAGVDILRSNRGPLVIEVNANPGFKELERVAGTNIAEAILRHALELV